MDARLALVLKELTKVLVALGQTVETKDLKAEAIKDQDKVVQQEELRSQAVMLNSIKAPAAARMGRVTREAMAEMVVDRDLTMEVRVASREQTDRMVVLGFLEARILLLALLPKRLDVVTETRMALDSASRVIATVNPSMVSSPGWWQF